VGLNGVFAANWLILDTFEGNQFLYSPTMHHLHLPLILKGY
jgi:hypothetical protein